MNLQTENLILKLKYIYLIISINVVTNFKVINIPKVIQYFIDQRDEIKKKHLYSVEMQSFENKNTFIGSFDLLNISVRPIHYSFIVHLPPLLLFVMYNSKLEFH